MLTGSLSISHLKSHPPALHLFCLLFIDFPANALNLSGFPAQLAPSVPEPSCPAISLHFRTPPHRDGCNSLPCMDWLRYTQGCPHHSYPYQLLSWCFPCMWAACCASLGAAFVHSPCLFWAVKDGTSCAAPFLLAQAPSASCREAPLDDNPGPPAAWGHSGWHSSPRLHSE